MINPTLSYLSAVWSGTEDPFWPHVVLVPLSVLAGLSVGFGIIFDRPKFSEAIRVFAFWLIVVGVPTESICTVLLFVVDERISIAQQSIIDAQQSKIDKQQSEIISLREFAKAAGSPRTLDANKLLERLTGKPTATAEVLYDRSAMDAYPLAAELWRFLKVANWSVKPSSGPEPLREPPPDSPFALLPLPMTVHAWPWGISVIANRDFDPKDESDPLRNLVSAVRDSTRDFHTGNTDKSLADNVFRIVIGPRTSLTPADP
jgi:hypothetical protein